MNDINTIKPILPKQNTIIDNGITPIDNVDNTQSDIPAIQPLQEDSDDTNFLTDTKSITEFSKGVHNSLFEFSNMFVPEADKEPLQDTKGVSGVTGEILGQLVNPVNVAIGLGTGGASLALGGVTRGLARIIAIGASEFTGGLGYTLADHYQKKLSNYNDELTTKGLLIGGAIGGVLGTGLHALGGFKSFEDQVHIPDSAMQDLSGFVHSNPDLPLVNYAMSNNLEFNSQNGGAYRLNFDGGQAPIKETIEPSKDNLLARLGLDENSKATTEDAHHISRAKEMEDIGTKLKDVSADIEYSNNEFDARYSQMLNDADPETTSHLFNPKNDFNIRKSLQGETIGLSDTDIKASKLYNDIDKSLIDEAQNSGVDIGHIEGYVKQIHDTDRMRLVTPDEWVDYIKPRLSDDIDSATLKRSYEKLVTLDTDQHFTPLIQQKSVKARVFTFKDAQSQVEYEDRFGYKKLIGSHLVDNINSLKHHIVLNNVVGTDNPVKVLKYLGKLNKLTNSQINAHINNISSASIPIENSLLGKGISSIITASRLSNALVKPIGTLISKLPLDFMNATVQSIGKYGLGNTTRGILAKAPTDDIKYLANLPFEQRETFANIIASLKEQTKLDHFDIMGAQIKDNTPKYLKLGQRAYLKIGGMHMLDNMTRKYALKLANTAIKYEYKTNGLDKLLPNVDKEILAKSINDSGELVPTKLDELANTKYTEMKSAISSIKEKNNELYNTFTLNEDKFKEDLYHFIKNDKLYKQTVVKTEIKNKLQELNKINNEVSKIKKDISNVSGNPDDIRDLNMQIKSSSKLQKNAETALNKVTKKLSSLNLDLKKAKNTPRIEIIKSNITTEKQIKKQYEDEIIKHKNDIKGFNSQITNSDDIVRYNILKDNLAYGRKARDDVLEEIANTTKNLKSSKDLYGGITALKNYKYLEQNTLLNKIDGHNLDIETLYTNGNQYIRNHRDVSNKLKTLYAKSINDANPIYSPVLKSFNKYDPSVAAGARSMLWVVRMYHATYKDLLTRMVNGDKKLFAGATAFATASALSVTEMAYNHLLNSISGKETKETTGFKTADHIIKHNIDDPLLQAYTTAMLKHLTVFTSMVNAPIYYGSGANAIRAGMYYMEDNPEKAQEYMNKSAPIIGATINAWGYVSDE